MGCSRFRPSQSVYFGGRMGTQVTFSVQPLRSQQMVGALLVRPISRSLGPTAARLTAAAPYTHTCRFSSHRLRHHRLRRRRHPRGGPTGDHLSYPFHHRLHHYRLLSHPTSQRSSYLLSLEEPSSSFPCSWDASSALCGSSPRKHTKRSPSLAAGHRRSYQLIMAAAPLEIRFVQCSPSRQ